MRTSFHHQPEAQHLKSFSYPQERRADYPIFARESGHRELATIQPL
jgi:hypothetical protein